jgi:hypothetical protein
MSAVLVTGLVLGSFAAGALVAHAAFRAARGLRGRLAR